MRTCMRSEAWALVNVYENSMYTGQFGNASFIARQVGNNVRSPAIALRAPFSEAIEGGRVARFPLECECDRHKHSVNTYKASGFSYCEND